MENVLKTFEKYRLIPVVTVRNFEEAETVLGALCRGGIPVAEICLRTACAEEVIRYAVEKFPEMLIGAGTVTDEKQCQRAFSAGAKFIVSPGFSKKVAKACKDHNVEYFPGAVTPTEIMEALSEGFTYLKFFPAEQFGGLNAIRALSNVFPQVKFMPTGGIVLENINEYLDIPQIFACGGSWMVKGSATEIEQKTRAAVMAIKGKKAD